MSPKKVYSGIFFLMSLVTVVIYLNYSKLASLDKIILENSTQLLCVPLTGRPPVCEKRLLHLPLKRVAGGALLKILYTNTLFFRKTKK